MKKLYLSLLLLLVLVVSSCTLNGVTLPNLEGKSRSEIIEIMEEYNLKYEFKFENTIINDESQLDKFVRYGNNYKVGSSFPSDNMLYIYTTVLPLNPSLYQTVKMDFDWEGKSFINDGYGEVTFSYPVDGDTAWFIDKVTGERFKLRFLGINTPETHAGEDPWGLAAAAYTEERLKNAKQIVLEAEGARKETYDRYLGFVWVDGVLLNLEIVEQAYSRSNLSSSKYEDVFLEASFNAMLTGRRVYGEIDSQYDYEKGRFK